VTLIREASVNKRIKSTTGIGRFDDRRRDTESRERERERLTLSFVEESLPLDTMAALLCDTSEQEREKTKKKRINIGIDTCEAR
jgi:hypothetical protein